MMPPLVEVQPAEREPLPHGADVQLWQRDVFLAPVGAFLPRLEVLSLDVFDTLIFRACPQPEDVFLEAGRRAQAAGLLAPGLSAGEFAALRRAAQEAAYRTLGREPRLEEIYTGLSASLGATEALVGIELETEADLCFLNPAVDSLVAHCNRVGIPVVLLSDMYLGEVRVRALLRRAGFDVDRRVRRVVVSVDAGGYKMTGALYKVLGEMFPQVEPGAMLHIGDNVVSDVRAARAAGLRAVHYDVVGHDPDGTRALEQLACGDLLPELSSIRRLAQAACADVPAAARVWHRIGAGVVGPFVAALADWALDQCASSGSTLLAPLMREGHLLTPILQRAAAARGMTIEVAPLYVSRHAVALAGVRDAGEDLVTRLFEGRRHFTIGDLYTLVAVPLPDQIRAHAHVLTSSAHTIEATPGASLRAWIQADLTSEAMQPTMRRLVNDQRALLVSYLEGVFREHRTVTTLDIGFFGQIQASLDVALGGARHPVQLTHLLGFGHGPVRDRVLEGRNVRTFAGGYGSDSDLVKTIHRSAPVLEQLLQGPEGTTTGYIVDGDVTVAVRESNPLPPADLAGKKVVQGGMFAYQDLWLALRRSHPSMIDGMVDRRGAWCRLVHRLIDVPSHAEARALGSLSDDLNFGTRAVLPFCPPSVEAQIAWTGARRSYLSGAASLPAIWPQGAITRVDSAAIVLGHVNSARSAHVAAALGLAHAIRSRGVARVVGYGTGEVAIAFLDAASILGLEVATLVDSNTSLHGQHLRGIEISSLDHAMARGIHIYAVLSVAHAAPIIDTIRRRYGSEPVAPLILDVASSTPVH